MTRLTQLQTTFASGELDPTLRGQADLKAYSQGAKQARDVQRRSTGGLERRYGTYDLSAVAAAGRGESFEFASDQRYGIIFENAAIEIFDTAGALLQTIGSCPWDATTLWQMSTAQLGDVMVITHQGFWPRILKRTSLTTFTLSLLAFDVSSNSELVYQPYYKFTDPSITITPSAATGAGITLTAKDSAGSAFAAFSANHVGLRFRIYDAEVLITAFTSSSVLVGTVQGELRTTLDLDPFKTEKGSNDVIVTHLFHGLKTGASLTFTGCNTTGSIPAAFFNGTRAITVIDEHHYKMTLTGVSYNYWEDATGSGTPSSVAYTSARLSEDGGGPNVHISVAGIATRRWMEPSVSAVRGYPGACCFHEMRMVLAGTGSQPDAVFMSNSLQFFRFDAGKGYDADSVQVAVGVEDISRIVHVVSNDDLQLFTPTSEMAFQVRQGEAITPNNARIKVFSHAGSSNVQPTPFDGATLFTQENGVTVYEFAFSDSMGKYLATPVSTLAAHLIRTPVQIATTPGLTSRAEQFAFIVNSDGTVAVFHSMRSENIAGWGLWTIAGCLVKSVYCLGEEVFFVVTRSGSPRLYKLSSSDLVSLDGAVLQTVGSPATAWTLNAKVRTRTVDIITDAGYYGTLAVPFDGIVTLPSTLNVVAGNAFYPVVETMPPNLSLPTGERKGMVKRLVRSIIDFHQSKKPTVDGVPLVDNDGSTISAWDGPYEMYHMGFDREPTITLSQSQPLGPWRVLSVNQEVDV